MSDSPNTTHAQHSQASQATVHTTVATADAAPRVDYHAMIRADLEELVTKYSTLMLTERGINPKWIAAIRIAELFL